MADASSSKIVGDIAVVDLDQLQLDPRNANKRDEIEGLKDSYSEFGQDKPLVVQRSTSIVIKGNHGLKAMRELGWDQCRVIWVDDDDATALRRGLADNRTGETRSWDEPLLRELLQEAGGEVPGFDKDFLQELLRGNTPDEPPDPGEPPAAPVAAPGDVWMMGNHRIACGDSTDSDVVAALVGDSKIAMIFTDPPYGMNLDTDFSGMQGIGTGNVYKPVQGDDVDYDPAHIFRDFPKVKEVFLWGADYYAERIPNRVDGSWVVWDKMGGGEGVKDSYEKMFGSNFELCWSKTPHKRAFVRVLWKGIFGLSGEDTKKRVHPTQKPTEAVRWFLERFCKTGEIVVDLFAGSASTLVACEQTGRVAYLAEIDPAYVDVSVERWQAYTGLQATLEGSNKTWKQVKKSRKGGN